MLNSKRRVEKLIDCTGVLSETAQENSLATEVLPNLVVTGQEVTKHLLAVASITEELNFNLHLILIHLNLNSYTWVVAKNGMLCMLTGRVAVFLLMVKGTFFKCHYLEKEILFINLSSCLNTRKRHEHTNVSLNSTRPHFSYASCPILLNCSYKTPSKYPV